MEKKQVIIVTLLVIAIVLSAASVMMSVSVLDDVSINKDASTKPSNNIVLEVLPPIENTEGGLNGLG